MIINKGYLNSLNWFRGLAILFVVLTHVDSGSLNSNIAQYIKTFVGNGTFYFVFISGYLFFHLIHKYSYLDYLRKKFLYVLIPYVFILSISILIFFQDYISKMVISFQKSVYQKILLKLHQFHTLKYLPNRMLRQININQTIA